MPIVPSDVCVQAKKLRLEMGLSLKYVAQWKGETEAFLAAVESGAYDDRDMERRYLYWLEARRSRWNFGPSASENTTAVGSGSGPPSDYRGTPLDPHFDYEASVPAGWSILAIARTACDAEVGFLYNYALGRYGLIGFYWTDDGLEVGRVIPFDADHRDTSFQALTAFVWSAYPDEREPARTRASSKRRTQRV